MTFQYVTVDEAIKRSGVRMVVVGGAKKLDHLRRAGRAAVVVRQSFRWASAEGPVRLLGPDDPPGPGEADVPSVIRAIFVAAGGTHEDWDEFDRVMRDDRRCAVFVDPVTVTGVG